MGVGVAVFGFFLTAVGPISFEVAVEVAFPVNEANSGGLLMTCTSFTIIVGVSGTLGVEMGIWMGMVVINH